MEVALTSKKLFNTLFFAFIFLSKKDMCTLLETFSERWKNPEGPDADNINIILQYDVDLIQNMYLTDLQFKMINGK